MSNLLTTLKQARLVARKNKNNVQAKYLTTFLGDMQTKEKNGQQLTDEFLIKEIQKVVNSLYDNARMVEDPEVFLEEAAFFEGYLPKQLSEHDIRVIAVNFITDFGIPTNPGPIMKYLKDNYAGQYDGKLAGSVVRDVI